jgi:hypothetical protein
MCLAAQMMADTTGVGWTAVGALATVGLLLAAIWAGLTAKGSITAAAAGVASQIDEHRKLERRRRTYELLSTYLSSDFIERTGITVPVLRQFEQSRQAGVARWEKLNESDWVTVTAVLNFYELVATEYNAGFLDQDVADKHLAYATVMMWRAAQALVKWLQERDPRYYNQWQYLFETSAEAIEAAAASPTSGIPVASPG